MSAKRKQKNFLEIEDISLSQKNLPFSPKKESKTFRKELNHVKDLKLFKKEQKVLGKESKDYRQEPKTLEKEQKVLEKHQQYAKEQKSDPPQSDPPESNTTKTGFSKKKYLEFSQKSSLFQTGMSSGSGVIESSETVMVDSPLYTFDQESQIHTMPAYIVCLLGPDELVGRYWAVSDKENISIGRNRHCDIPIQDLSISKKHLYFHIKGSGIFIEDQHSTNGTFINDELVNAGQEIQLKDNSKLKLGNITFKFLDRGNPEIVAIKENFEKAFRDPLTGIGNKSMLERRAKELFMQCKKNKTPLSLIMFDIDHFKKVNDTYGHLAGDFILKEVVSLIQTCFRSSDLFIRCGGEEFCIIMQSLADRAESAIETARKKLEKHIFAYNKLEIKVTISAGVTALINRDKYWKHLYERADKLLYKSKTRGRNRVSTSL